MKTKKKGPASHGVKQALDGLSNLTGGCATRAYFARGMHRPR